MTEYANQLNANENIMDLRPSSLLPLRSVMNVQAMLKQTKKDDVAVTQTRPSGPNAHSHTLLLLLLRVFLSPFPLVLTSPVLLRSRFFFFTPFFSFLFPFFSLISFHFLPFICSSSAYHSHFLFSLHSFIYFHCITPVSHFILIGIPPSIVRLVIYRCKMVAKKNVTRSFRSP